MNTDKIVIIHGQNHKGSTYHVARILAEKIAPQGNITEFFLPKDLNHFCLGCYRCVDDEAKCPFHEEKKVISQAMEDADVLIFATPNYCMNCSGPMKSFIDLFFQNWIIHRPKAAMFHKRAAVISTTAGVGTGKAIAPVKRTLQYWGVPNIYTYGIAVSASSFQEVSASKKQKLERDLTKLARKIEKAKIGKPSLFIRMMFLMMRGAKQQSKADSYDYGEKLYWQSQGWLDGKLPWK